MNIPVTVVAGYLGAGKTTLINRVLAHADGERLAVLVNDFGDINIDASLIRQHSDDVMELSNGCVCCSIGDDLTAALTAITHRTQQPTRVLLECSGVAEPSRVSKVVGFWPGFELASVVVLADAQTVRQRADDKFVGKLIRSQLHSAHRVALSRVDVTNPEQLTHVMNWVQAQYPQVQVTALDPQGFCAEWLFGTARLSTNSSTDPNEVWTTFRPLASRTEVAMQTWTWRPKGQVDVERLEQVLRDGWPQLARVKGVVRNTTNQAVVVQCTAQQCTVEPHAGTANEGLVMIASPDVSWSTLQQALSACAAS